MPHPLGEIPVPSSVSRRCLWGWREGLEPQGTWGAGTWQPSPVPWGQCHFLSLQGLCQGRTHRLDGAVPSRNEMVSGPDEQTNSICPGCHQEQIPASGSDPCSSFSLLWWICFSGCQGHLSEMTGGVPLGRAAKVSGKPALADFLLMLAPTGSRMTTGLSHVSPKPGAPVCRSRVP